MNHLYLHFLLPFILCIQGHSIHLTSRHLATGTLSVHSLEASGDAQAPTISTPFNNKSCGICLDPIGYNNTPVSLFKCHANDFCMPCVQKHIDTQVEEDQKVFCPMCRTPLNHQELNDTQGPIESLIDLPPDLRKWILADRHDPEGEEDFPTPMAPFDRQILHWHRHMWGYRLLLENRNGHNATVFAIDHELQLYRIVARYSTIVRYKTLPYSSIQWPFQEEFEAEYSFKQTLQNQFRDIVKAQQKFSPSGNYNVTSMAEEIADKIPYLKGDGFTDELNYFSMLLVGDPHMVWEESKAWLVTAHTIDVDSAEEAMNAIQVALSTLPLNPYADDAEFAYAPPKIMNERPSTFDTSSWFWPYELPWEIAQDAQRVASSGAKSGMKSLQETSRGYLGVYWESHRWGDRVWVVKQVLPPSEEEEDDEESVFTLVFGLNNGNLKYAGSSEMLQYGTFSPVLIKWPFDEGIDREFEPLHAVAEEIADLALHVSKNVSFGRLNVSENFENMMDSLPSGIYDNFYMDVIVLAQMQSVEPFIVWEHRPEGLAMWFATRHQDEDSEDEENSDMLVITMLDPDDKADMVDRIEQCEEYTDFNIPLFGDPDYSPGSWPWGPESDV